MDLIIQIYFPTSLNVDITSIIIYSSIVTFCGT
jgi:hypothetical protein